MNWCLNIKEYLEERLFIILFNLGCLFLIDFILYISKINVTTILSITILYILSIFIIYTFEYIKKKSYSKELNTTLDSLEEKYLLSEIIDEPYSVEFKEFYDVLKICNKSMNDKINDINIREKEFREFIELWVHEVKTPIASSKLTIQNNKNIVTESIEEDLNKVEYFIEQALFYARSNNVNKDFMIREITLDKVINNSIKKYSKLLIKNRVKIVKNNTDIKIYSDDKWLEFIIGQIISNSIKYFDKDEKILSFTAKKEKERVDLIISDNGTGIEEKYLDKIFDKGFTGSNGRSIKEATGIGLYLCKKLSNKLHIEILASSKVGEGTKMYISFPKSSQFFLK